MQAAAFAGCGVNFMITQSCKSVHSVHLSCWLQRYTWGTSISLAASNCKAQAQRQPTSGAACSAADSSTVGGSSWCVCNQAFTDTRERQQKQHICTQTAEHNANRLRQTASLVTFRQQAELYARLKAPCASCWCKLPSPAWQSLFAWIRSSTKLTQTNSKSM